MDKIALNLNIKKPSDWGSISIQKINEFGGNSLLSLYYNGSLFTCLQSVYKGLFKLYSPKFNFSKDVEWKKEWFHNIPNSPRLPKLYWRSIANRKRLLDEISLKLKIKKPSDWGTVTNQIFCALGGTSLLSYHKGSLLLCLKSVYKGFFHLLRLTTNLPEIEWQVKWFPKVRRFPKRYWNSIENCKKFLEDVALSSNIKEMSDWRKISNAFIRTRGGTV